MLLHVRKLCAPYLPLISGPPTLVKQDVKVSSPLAMRERESALAVAAGRTNLSELARVNSENEARPGTRENDGKKPPLIRILYRGHAESDQADSIQARGPSTNLSGLSGLRSEFHARHELQKTVCARQKEMQASAINGEWLLDGAFKASHESILLEVGLFSFGRLRLMRLWLVQAPTASVPPSICQLSRS